MWRPRCNNPVCLQQCVVCGSVRSKCAWRGRTCGRRVDVDLWTGGYLYWVKFAFNPRPHMEALPPEMFFFCTLYFARQRSEVWYSCPLNIFPHFLIFLSVGMWPLVREIWPHSQGHVTAKMTNLPCRVRASHLTYHWCHIGWLLCKIRLSSHVTQAPKKVWAHTKLTIINRMFSNFCYWMT